MVTIFKDGTEFLRQNSGVANAPYDAVVIYYHMPDLNAMETIERLEEQFRQTCKICVVSGEEPIGVLQDLEPPELAGSAQVLQLHQVEAAHRVQRQSNLRYVSPEEKEAGCFRREKQARHS